MRTFFNLCLLFLVFIGTGVLSGCATTSGISGSKVYMQEGKVKVDNDSLARAIDIVDLNSILVGDLLKASVKVHSKRTDTLELQYKFRWYDSQGMEIESESSPWKPIIIYGRETESMQAVAPNSNVKEFKFEIRYRK